MVIQVKCPNCNDSYAASEKLAGQSVKCMKCGLSFRAPTVPGSAIESSERKPENHDLHADLFSDTPSPNPGMKRRVKYWTLLIIGVAITVIVQLFAIRDANSSYAALKAFAYPLAYFVILGLIALIVGAIRRDVRRHSFPTLAWLFLVAALFSVVAGDYTRLFEKSDFARMVIARGYPELFMNPEFRLMIEESFHTKVLTESQTQTADVDPVTALETLGAKFTRNEQSDIWKVTLLDTKITYAIFMNLKAIGNLKELRLSETMVTDAGVINLQEALPNCRITFVPTSRSNDAVASTQMDDSVAALETLGATITRNDQDEIIGIYLVDTQVSNSELVHLAGLINLQKLDFSETQVSDGGLLHLKRLNNLQEVQLFGTHITNVGLLHLEALTNLEEITLSNTHVTDIGLRHLRKLENLKTLELAGTKITDAGLGHIFWMDNLKHLDVMGTQITDEGLIHLTGLKNLRWLRAFKTQITDAGVAELKRSLPLCDIYYLKTTSADEADRQRLQKEHRKRLKDRNDYYGLRVKAAKEASEGILRGPAWMRLRLSYIDPPITSAEANRRSQQAREKAASEYLKYANKMARKNGYESWEHWKTHGGPTEFQLQSLRDQPTFKEAFDEEKYLRKTLGPQSVEAVAAAKRRIETQRREKFIEFAERQMETQ